jgi:predicted HAD superfamily Cof-like phosphohydrolase
MTQKTEKTCLSQILTLKTDYQKVCDFNQAFDFPQYDYLQSNDFQNEKCLKLRLALIEEELSELKTAYEKHDYIEEMDACADILYVAYGMAYTYKIDSDKFLNYLIKDNNLSLFQNIKNNQTETKTKIDLLDLIFGQFKKLTERISLQILTLKSENSILTERISLQILTLRSENSILTECCNLNNKEWIQALHDLIIYVYNFQVVAKYNSDKIFTLVHDSNMTKLCKTEIEAIQTVQKYQQEFENKKSPYDSPYYYQLTDGTYSGYYIVKNKSTGKALKSINYTEVKLNLTDYIL